MTSLTLVLFICGGSGAVASSTAPDLPPRLAPAPTFAEPYLPLSGGAFSGVPLLFHPDPLGSYVWAPSVNKSLLQTYALLPASVTLTPGTTAGAFTGVDSLLGDAPPHVGVAGVGGLQLDFAINSAAWIEFESADLTSADAKAVELSVSEYDEYEMTNLGPKVGAPVAHTRADEPTLWRLELPHPDLYEGVRFAWLRVNSTPAVQWTITALRLVCQIKPTNYGGAFAAKNDDDLSRVWALGAYTVKVNLLSDQFGSILIYRGDRFSWTGDAHIAQATAMVALGNFDFVKENLRFTQRNCNGIESYCLYFVLSVVDYFMATNDAALAEELVPSVVPKLEHAHSVWGSTVHLGFYGWDDRLGSGFVDSTSSNETQAAYRALAIRSWRAWAAVCAAVGNATDASHWTAYADAATSTIRASGSPAWYESIGLFAVADAVNAGVSTPAEAAGIVALRFNDLTTICSLSPFNTFFALEALASFGELDRGLATVHACWDVMLRLGATTTWEIAKPAWEDLFPPTSVIAQFQGYTSMAHPWSSGATAWSSRHLAGVRATAPGYATFVVAPHIAGNMSGISATVPLPNDEAIVMRATGMAAGAAASICVATPLGPRAGALHVSELLAARLTGSAARIEAAVFFAHGAPCACEEGDASSGAFAMQQGEETVAASAPLVWGQAAEGPVDPMTGARVRVARIPLRAGGCMRVALRAVGAAIALQSAPNPFPPPAWPAYFVGRDQVTSGSFLGVYGSAGHFLVAFDGPDQHVSALPPWVISVTQPQGGTANGPWLDPPPANNSVALQDPRAPTGPRKIGQWCNELSGPTFPVDVTVMPAPANMTYQFSFYFADYDSRGRRETVQLMDGVTLEDISPAQLVGPDFTGGVWYVWQYPRSIRLRVNFVRGTNAVISAIALDAVTTVASV